MRRGTGRVVPIPCLPAAHAHGGLEQFIVGSLEERLRQDERVSRRDQERIDAARAMTEPNRPPTVTHLLTPARRERVRGSRPAFRQSPRRARASGRRSDAADERPTIEDLS